MKILLADGHALYRAGLRALLDDLDPSLTVVEVGDGAALDRHLTSCSDFELAIVDLELARNYGTKGLARLIQDAPTVPFVALADSADREEVQQALDLGALGVISKRESAAVILHALRTVLAGDIYVPDRLGGVTASSRTE